MRKEILQGLSLPFLWNYLIDLAKVKFGNGSLLNPLVCSYYITLRCNFRCSFCGFAQSRESVDELNTSMAIKLLEILRRSCPSIYFTGGEPLLRDDIVEILRTSKQLGYKSVSLNTNLSLIHKKRESLKYIDNLIVSLNEMDNGRFANSRGISIRMAQQVKENLAACSRLQREQQFTLTVNCVVTHENIEDTFGVMDYCFQNGIGFAVVPAELEYGYLDKKLVTSTNYRNLVKAISAYKRQGLPVFNSFLYLDYILNIREFTCYPTMLPHVYPNGNLFYPCQPMRKVAANILETNSYKKALKEGIRKHGAIPECRDRCYIACYIESSMSMKHPLRYLREIVG